MNTGNVTKISRQQKRALERANKKDNESTRKALHSAATKEDVFTLAYRLGQNEMRVDAIIECLIKKNILTEEEITEAINDINKERKIISRVAKEENWTRRFEICVENNIDIKPLVDVLKGNPTLVSEEEYKTLEEKYFPEEIN
jgi:hypothetical protein